MDLAGEEVVHFADWTITGTDWLSKDISLHHSLLLSQMVLNVVQVDLLLCQHILRSQILHILSTDFPQIINPLW